MNIVKMVHDVNNVVHFTRIDNAHIVTCMSNFIIIIVFVMVFIVYDVNLIYMTPYSTYHTL